MSDLGCVESALDSTATRCKQACEWAYERQSRGRIHSKSEGCVRGLKCLIFELPELHLDASTDAAENLGKLLAVCVVFHQFSRLCSIGRKLPGVASRKGKQRQRSVPALPRQRQLIPASRRIDRLKWTSKCVRVKSWAEL